MKALWTAIAALVFAAGDARAQRAPIPIDNWTLELHRIAGEPYLRSPRARSESSIALELIVNEEGEVASVQIDPDRTDLSRSERGDRFLLEARDQLRAWRFRPIQRDGRPVPARVGVDLDVLPPERSPRRRLPFPDVPAADVEITLERSDCYGGCAAYRITVRGDGQVQFEGLANTLVLGVHHYRIPAAEAERLVDRFRNSNFWSLDGQYEAQIEDGQSTLLGVRAGRATKAVLDYEGLSVGMPAFVAAIQQAVDETTDAARFTTGNDQSLAALEAEGFDFGSPAAAAVALASLGDAPEALTLALIERGAPLDLPAPGREGPGRTFRKAMAERAVIARRPAVFARLAAEPSATIFSQQELDRLLVEAATSRSALIVQRLLELGARAGPQGASRSILADALRYRWIDPPPTSEERAEVIGLLITHGAPVEAHDDRGRTALQNAGGGGPETVQLLIEAGANVDAGDPPLLYETEDEDVALLLLAAGANRTLRNQQGWTLAQIARRYEWLRVLAILGDGAR
jgi:hypothetical protein